MPKCDVCGREFKTKSGLISHTRAKHPSTELRTGPAFETEAMGMVGDEDKLLAEACKQLGIEEVMSWKVYPDERLVVIIEGPVGREHYYEY
jgi:hypothetical protein